MIDQPGHRDRGLEQGHGSRGLNNAYAILENQVSMQIVAEGLDPTIGFLHTSTPERQALVLDLMEPYRPLVDRSVLEFVQAHTFHPADFTIRGDGVCRINPEMARRLVDQLHLTRRSEWKRFRNFSPEVKEITC